MSPSGIVFFDIDGTLVTGTSSGAFLAQRLGHAREMNKAEADYAAGVIDNDQVCAIDAQGWAGAAQSEIELWLLDLPLVTGIEETVAWCHSRNLLAVVASLAWDVVGAHLAGRFGFADYCGPRLQSSAGRYTGKVDRSFDEFDKRNFALDVCHRTGVSPERCVAIGDSRSDLPLFDVVDFSIALNASADARAKASVSLDSDSITDTTPLISAWQNQRTNTSR